MWYTVMKAARYLILSLALPERIHVQQGKVMMLKAPTLSLAVEEEYQWISPETGELKAVVIQRLTPEGTLWRRFTPEADRFVDELLPTIPRVRTVQELEFVLSQQRKAIIERAETQGLQVLVAGTHPFSLWNDPEEALIARFRGTIRTLDEMLPRLLFFGLTVQVGIEDRNLAVDMMDVVRYMMPHILAISASSPFWRGEDTGLQSFRSTLLDNVPRSGIPDRFRTWSAYQRFLTSMVRTHSVERITDVWWDVRVHPILPVLEFRVCDANPRLLDVLALAALFQALAAWQWDLRRHNLTFRLYHGDLIKENRWRAARYGLDTKLIDFGKQEEVPAKSLIRELLHLVIEYADALNARHYLERIYTILEIGTSATRQRRVATETGSLLNVVKHLVIETAQDVDA